MEPVALISFHYWVDLQLKICFKSQTIEATSHHNPGTSFNIQNFKSVPMLEVKSPCKMFLIGLDKFPVFSASAKMNIQISCFLCPVATLTNDRFFANAPSQTPIHTERLRLRLCLIRSVSHLLARALKNFERLRIAMLWKFPTSY